MISGAYFGAMRFDEARAPVMPRLPLDDIADFTAPEEAAHTSKVRIRWE